eukprot:EG_transcript_168
MPRFRLLLFLLWARVVGCFVGKRCAGPALDMWGLNSYRQLGFSDQVPRYSPTTLPLPHNEAIHCVALGGSHSAVQTATGQWYSFGRNDLAQLGLNHGMVTTSAQPIPAIDGSQVVDVVLGDSYTLLQTAAGVWYGVGYNDPGMLGLNYTASRVVTPTAMLLPNVTVAKMVTSYYTAGLVGADGSLYIWGDGTYGQIGNNVSRTQPYTTPQLVPLTSVTNLALSIYNSWAITASGKYYVWGLNRAGQLGTGDLLTRLNPTLVTPPNGGLATHVVAGYMTVAFRTDDGSWYMNGQNQYGQLGDLSLPSIVTTPTPFPRLGGANITYMAAGMYHWMGITDANVWYVWGYNYDGELGLGNTNDVNSPQPFITTRGETVYSMALGSYHSAALRSATYTPTLTPTATAVPCPGSNDFSSGTLSVGLNTQCRTVYRASGSVGSDSWFNRFILVNVLTLRAGYMLDTELVAGCVAASCFSSFSGSAGGFPRITYVPVGSTSEVLLAMSFHPPATAAASNTASRRTGATGADVELSMAYKGSPLLLGLACAFTAVGVLLLCVFIWWRYWVRRQKADDRVRRHDAANEKAEAVCSVLLTFGVWCLTVGVLWLIIGLLTTQPFGLFPELFITGASLAGVGFVLIVGCGIFLLRDPVSVKCPECSKPVSRWKFRDTYVLAQEGEEAPFSKAHTRHVRCQACKRPVVQDRWPASAPCRPYHRDCWEAFCSKAVLDSQYFNTWWENSQAQAPKVELVHMLAMAITTKETEAVERFAQLDPKLIFTPILLSGMRTPIQLAALFGHRDMVEMLLQRGQPRTLDAACPVDPLAPQSMRIYGLDKEDNDLYLYQPNVLYNDQPVFVGHTFGKYVYYYEPSLDPGERHYAPGWCLSPHLGSGCTKFRLRLDEAISVRVIPKATNKSQLGRQGSLLHRMKTWLLTRSKKGAAATAAGVAKDKEKDPSSDGSSLSNSMRPPTPATHMSAEKLIDVQVDWVSHATSLLEDAIASGNQATMEFVLQQYHRQDPGCLLWHYRTKQRLWEVYPPADQRDIRDAIAGGLTHVVLGNGDGTRTLSFEEMEQRCDEGRRPIKYLMRTIIQYIRKGHHTTSDVDAVWEWEESCIVFAPGHAAAAAPDEKTLTFLLEEGVVDHSLWAPPCHNSGAWRVLAEDYSRVLDGEVAEELSLALGTPAHLLARTLSSVLTSHTQVVSSLPKRSGENRLTDGLTAAPQDDAHVAFYDPSYASDTWSLPFCLQLPRNKLGLTFHEEVIVQMSMDALKKAHELQRQWFPQPLRHCLALYVYTYEMVFTSGLTDQIYSCMNRAMRLRDAKQIEFWRPLIWEIDQALQAFPALPTKSFRGINCTMDAALYKAGGHICWPSFSSASQSRSVAEEFAKGDSGTLFFLQGTTPRHIAMVSRYPDEDEVLFGPNSVFEITTTLQQTSDIGQFYGKVDNIAMKQVGGSVVPGLKPRPVGYTSMLVHVPPSLGPHLIGWLARMPMAAIESIDLLEERSDGVSAHIVVGDGPCGVLLPNELLPSPLLRPSTLVHRLPISPPEEEVPDPLPTGSRATTSARRCSPSPTS